MIKYTEQELTQINDDNLIRIFLEQSNTRKKCCSIIDSILDKEYLYNKAARDVPVDIKDKACEDYIDHMVRDYSSFLSKDELIPAILFNQTTAGKAIIRANSAIASCLEKNLTSWMTRFAAMLDKFYEDTGTETVIANKQVKIIN